MNIRKYKGKDQILCEWRHRWVRLTPEEWVRQQFLHRLVEELHYMPGRIAVEAPIQVGNVQKRCDAVIYDQHVRPMVLIEFKAEYVALNQKVLDQAVVYNRELRVPWLILHNGPKTIVVKIKEQEIIYQNTIPEWKELSN